MLTVIRWILLAFTTMAALKASPFVFVFGLMYVSLGVYQLKNGVL